MAKAGWEGGSSSDDDPDAESYDAPSDDDEGIGLLKLAENLSRAAHAIRLRYKHPTVRFVLPKLREGTITEIDNVIYQMRSMGIVVQTAEDVINSPPLENVLDRLLINEFESLTKIVNIDCTILLALVSDLSHTHVETQPWFHRAIRRQIEIEKSEPLFPNYLLPALHGRKLVCTVEAARRMREIVGLIGTPTEQGRMALLMGDDPNDNKQQIIKGLQKLSQHDMPVDWDLPIKVVDANVDMSLLPRSAVAIGERLSSINKSVFFYGWYNGLTTISSNRTVAKEIEALVEENRSDDKETGPDICLCPTARSLVGKEKDRKP